MNDMSSTIIAKSDQINAADLVGISRTITVKEVRIKAGEDQPVTIMIEGDKKAFRPCKGVRRLLVRVWGPDANKYIGQSLTVYCDPTVTWAGKPEGGIRVSHMTGLDEEIVEYMRTSREKTKPYKILPLQVDAPRDKAADDLGAWADKFIANVNRAPTIEKLEQYAENVKDKLHNLKGALPDAHAAAMKAIGDKRTSFGGPDDDDPYADPPAAEESPSQEMLRKFREAIEAAADVAGLDAFEAEWLNKHRIAFDEDAAGEIDGLITAKGKSLREAAAGGEKGE